MAAPKLNPYLPTFSFGCNNKLNIRERSYDFAAPIGEIITDMPYLCEKEI